ncbi:MAG: hypothetical protein K2H52_17370 [Lachnospiraceae bacterium]|nr:hypothetical protein [Lachnospiraceae bacterium]MDE6185513.1 hypothetical protein [Lachnospiraceae bacterium]MDE7285279.1 hypothetical protein [Lachnospiraceae bacterium]
MKTTLQKGDMILFFAGETWLSKSIAYLTNAEVTHASMVYSEDSIVEILADGPQVNKISLQDNDRQGHKAYLMRHVPELCFAPLKQSADAYLQSDAFYDFPGLFLLGGLLIYHKIIPSFQILNCTELILEAGILMLDRFIHQKLLHHTGKPMVCSQFIYQLFYDCGGNYRIPIVNGCFSARKNTDACCKGEICLADLLREGSSMKAENAISSFSIKEEDMDAPSFAENLSEKLYLALSQSEQALLDLNFLSAKPHDTSRVLSLARQFLDRVKQLQLKLDMDLPLDAMFVTVADLAYHAPSLEKIDTIYVKRL